MPARLTMFFDVCDNVLTEGALADRLGKDLSQ